LKSENGKKKIQDILFLNADANSLTSELIAMKILENGEISDGPDDADDWPYQCVLDAIKDGWHVIKFPELALTMDETRTYGFGFEFILTRNGGIR
jgi:hypothetical protein